MKRIIIGLVIALASAQTASADVYVNEHGNFIAFIDEGYSGSQPIQHLRDAGVAESITLNITPKQYNELKKRKAN